MSEYQKQSCHKNSIAECLNKRAQHPWKLLSIVTYKDSDFVDIILVREVEP